MIYWQRNWQKYFSAAWGGGWEARDWRNEEEK